MNFMPLPPNDFAKFMEAYFTRCRERVPEIEGIAGKWNFEDLIPGLSDFDTRFLVNDGMTVNGWCRMSSEVGRVHFDLAREHREWARILEHLPGVNLRWSELLDPSGYYPEFSQWSLYRGAEFRLAKARRSIEGHDWSRLDERYHWKKIAYYYGPYDREIDPPINLGSYENKYPLHSRLMHYLAPAVQSAVALLEKKTRPGKLGALRKAHDLFPERRTIALVLDLIDRHYEAPEYLTEPGLTKLDRALEAYLSGVVDVLLKDQAGIVCPRDPTVRELKAAVGSLEGAVSASPLFEQVKFARLMGGRLWFYGQEIPWFDSLPLIRLELGRLRGLFFETPLRGWARWVLGREGTPEEALSFLEGDVLERDQVEACRRFAALACPVSAVDELRPRALEIAAIFPPFLHALENLVRRSREIYPCLRRTHPGPV
jgi:hypothetical protein